MRRWQCLPQIRRPLHRGTQTSHELCVYERGNDGHHIRRGGAHAGPAGAQAETIDEGHTKVICVPQRTGRGCQQQQGSIGPPGGLALADLIRNALVELIAVDRWHFACVARAGGLS